MARSSKSNFALFLLTILTIAACAEAGGEIRGGEITPTGEKAAKPPGLVADAGPDDRPCGEGTTWSSIYRDIFGPTKLAGSCSFGAGCHGSATDDGAAVPNGILCADEKGCRQSMIDKGLVSETNASQPSSAILVANILRRRGDDGQITGIMPLEPIDYYFPPTCLDRIKGWIAGGIKED